MYKRFLITILFICFSVSISKAQNKLFLCTNYNEIGEYTGAYENWSIQRNGNFMYLFYESITPINDTISILIEKDFNRKDTNYYEYDHYYLVPDISKKWAVNKYTFTKPGRYKITAYDKNSNKVTQTYYTTIEFSEDAYSNDKTVDSWYYNTSNITYFEKNIKDTMVGKNTVFAYQPNNTKVILFIEQKNNKTLHSNHLFVSIFKDDECHQKINSDSYYINDNWHWTFIPIYFKNAGKYIVELYNDDDVFINAAKLEIK
jgi:hypothetical protein